ncbi:MAG: hypothetical protein K8R87_06195 [Verrucomicrobia bacterium]|nr:hypothetical protein [Verrucomicrobiota bacterium]
MKTADKIYRQESSAAIRLAAALVLGLAFFQSTAPAAVTPGATPKEFPANPARHQVVIKREAADAKQAAMIAVAEAAQPSKEALRQAAGDAAVPTGEKVWWYKEELGIRIPCAITADAVSYYTDLVGKFGKQVFKRYSQPSSRLDYHAGVDYHKEFKFDGITYSDVYVVTLKLTFSENFAATEAAGMEFKKERMVVLDAQGKVLLITGDGPTEVPILMM